MCYSRLSFWRRCGHFVATKEFCKQARLYSPPKYCIAAHMPVYDEVGEDSGNCPDRAKHALDEGEANEEGPIQYTDKL